MQAGRNGRVGHARKEGTEMEMAWSEGRLKRKRKGRDDRGVKKRRN